MFVYRFPDFINSDQLHANIVLAFVCELLAWTTRNIFSDYRMFITYRLEFDVITGTKESNCCRSNSYAWHPILLHFTAWRISLLHRPPV